MAPNGVMVPPARYYSVDASDEHDQGSGLVVEPAFGDQPLVFSTYPNVTGREQEDLVRYLLDASPQAEDEPGREVDEPLGVPVRHLGEVHDHWDAVPERLTDLPSFVVARRLQRRDLVRRSRLGRGLTHRLRNPGQVRSGVDPRLVAGLHVATSRHGLELPVFEIDATHRTLTNRLVHRVVVVIEVALVFLGQPEVDHRPAPKT